AKVVLQSLAVGRLRKHSRQRVFPDTAWARKQQRVRLPGAPRQAAQSERDFFVAQKFVEAHSISRLHAAGQIRALRPRREFPRGSLPACEALASQRRSIPRAPSSVASPDRRKALPPPRD